MFGTRWRIAFLVPRLFAGPARIVAAGVVLVPALVAAADAHAGARTGSRVTRDGVVAEVAGDTATLSNGVIARRWTLAGGVRTVALTMAGQAWARPGPDFSVDVDGAPTDSTSGWQLLDVRAVRPAARPGRPAAARGAALRFRYALADARLAPVGVELDRVVILRPAGSVFTTTTVLRNRGAAPVRVAAYMLDEVVTRGAAPAEVQAYHGGSDWRDDYRAVSHPSGAFDDEGEVLRVGSSSGVFLVAQRRGGIMSRVGRDATGRAWVGVDWARDLVDFGPLRDSPPSYNRFDNPAYPVPVRARLLRPSRALDLGTSYLGTYTGGPRAAAAAFSASFVRATEPAFQRTADLNTFHPWGHGAGMSDRNLRRQVDLAAGLGIDTFMLDDQWQGGPGGESGDWRFDPARFPDRNHDAVPDFVSYLKARGLRLGLWMSPVEFNMASQTYAAHPDWACAPVGDLTAQVADDAGLGVWDVTNPGLQAHLLSVVDRLVRSYGVAEFKFDFMAWVDCGTHDYADYEAAFVDLVHRMQRRHPGVTFELDETNDQRSWPFESAEIGPSWFDNGHLHGSGPVAKVLHDVWDAAPWVPTYSLGLGVFDGTLTDHYSGVAGVDALMPVALLTHPTFWTDLTTLTPKQRSETRWWLRWYATHREKLGPAVYELTTSDPISGRGWVAWEPWNGRAGYVVVVRQAGGVAEVSLTVQGVDPRLTYAVRDVRTGHMLGEYRGTQLAHGLRTALAPYSAALLAVTPVESR